MFLMYSDPDACMPGQREHVVILADVQHHPQTIKAASILHCIVCQICKQIHLVSLFLLHAPFYSQEPIRAGSQHLTLMGFEPTLVTPY